MYLARAKAVANLANSAGCRLTGPKMSHDEAFRVGGNEYRDHQQQYQPYIYKVGKHVVEGIVQHQQHKSQTERTDNPDKLLAGTGGEIQKVAVAIVITRPAHTEPAEHNQYQVDGNRHPIQ